MALSEIIEMCAPENNQKEMELEETDPHVKKPKEIELEEKDPHVMKPINIYLNDKGFQAFSRQLDYPSGTVIVKEKLDSGLQATSIGAMIKQNGVWQYYYKDTKVVQGRISTCVECHTRDDAKNEVFGFWAQQLNENNAPNIRDRYIEKNREK